MLRRNMLLAALSASLGCGSEPARGLAIDVGASPVAIDALRVSAYGPAGVLVEQQPFPPELPGRIRIDSGQRRERVRVVAFEDRAGAPVAFGFVDLDVAPGVDVVAALALSAPVPQDADGDGLPNPADARFDTAPVSARFPDPGECEALVTRGGPEPRPENATANATMPVALALPDWAAGDARVNTSIKPRISGAFSGTTDEILQWAACRWGIDEDLLRAWGALASEWRQTAVNGENYGVFQINPRFASGTQPWAQSSTAFNADYVAAWWRACYEGYWTWIEDPQPGSGYAPGDAEGCVGMWHSGRWYDAAARSYLETVRAEVARKRWLEPGF
jgi:hypothetical protein